MKLVGWSDLARDSPSEVTIAHMTGSVPAQRSLGKVDSVGTLAVHGEHGRCDLADDRTVATAIVGNPRWNEPELVAISITPEIHLGLTWDIMRLKLWFRSRTSAAQPFAQFFVLYALMFLVCEWELITNTHKQKCGMEKFRSVDFAVPNTAVACHSI